MSAYATSPASVSILLIRNSGREVIILLLLDLKKYGEEEEEELGAKTISAVL